LLSKSEQQEKEKRFPNEFELLSFPFFGLSSYFLISLSGKQCPTTMEMDCCYISIIHAFIIKNFNIKIIYYLLIAQLLACDKRDFFSKSFMTFLSTSKKKVLLCHLISLSGPETNERENFRCFHFRAMECSRSFSNSGSPPSLPPSLSLTHSFTFMYTTVTHA
jgi:hypothetical protein